MKKGAAKVKIIMLLLCGIITVAVWRNFSEETQYINTLVVRNTEEVIEQLVELGAENGYENALEELTEQHIMDVDGDKYYRLQQNYGGIPVYGKTVVCVTDQEGKAISVTGNVVDVDESISLIPTVTQEQVVASLKEWVINELAHSEADEIDTQSISNDALCIYISAITGNTHLAYKCHIGIYEIIVDAHNAEVLSAIATVVPKTESVTGYMATDDKRSNGFSVEKLGEYYYVMSDVARVLSVYTFDGQTSQDDTKFWRTRATIVESTDQIFGNTETEIALEYEDGAKLLLNVSRIYDYFEKLGFVSDTQNTNLYYNDNYDGGENALGGIVDGYGIISMGSVTGVNCIDVIAHEYTHFVSRELVGWVGSSENGALNEAISDIFGEIIESYMTGDEVDWLINESRSIAQPSRFQNPDFYGGDYWGDTSNPIKDNDFGYIHNNSTVISHAAYLMWNGIDGNSAKKISTDDLAKLWYRAVLMMPADCDFATCRQIVEWAALAIDGLTDSQRACITEAFDTVGIYDTELSAEVITECDRNILPNSVLNVYDIDGNLHSGYSLHIVGTIAEDELSYVTNILMDSGYCYETTKTIKSNTSYHLDLPDGYYTFTIYDQQNPQFKYTFTVSISEYGTEDIIELYTDFKNQLVVEITEFPKEPTTGDKTKSITKTVESRTALHCEWAVSGDFDDNGSEEIYAIVCTSKTDYSNGQLWYLTAYDDRCLFWLNEEEAETICNVVRYIPDWLAVGLINVADNIDSFISDISRYYF